MIIGMIVNEQKYLKYHPECNPKPILTRKLGILLLSKGLRL